MSECFRFIALQGVLGWGITCSILSTLVRSFRHGVPINSATSLYIFLFGSLVGCCSAIACGR
jgi:hypothetical protein